ncbi:MAG: hypothetical protein ACRDGS_01645 [Chloroflexota bacterium]
MAQDTRSLVLYYSPDLDMLPFAARLAALNATCVPLATMTPASERLAAATIYLVSLRYWSSCPPGSVAGWIAHLQDPDTAVLIVGMPGNQLPAPLQNEELSAQFLEPPVSAGTLNLAIRGALTAIRYRTQLAVLANQAAVTIENQAREIDGASD